MLFPQIYCRGRIYSTRIISAGFLWAYAIRPYSFYDFVGAQCIVPFLFYCLFLPWARCTVSLQNTYYIPNFLIFSFSFWVFHLLAIRSTLNANNEIRDFSISFQLVSSFYPVNCYCRSHSQPF